MYTFDIHIAYRAIRVIYSVMFGKISMLIILMVNEIIRCEFCCVYCTSPIASKLNQWGQVTHICVCKLTTISSDNRLLPDWRQAIMWTNAEMLLIGPTEISSSQQLNWKSYIFIQENTFENVACKMAAILSRSRYVKTNSRGKHSRLHIMLHTTI